MQCIPAISSLTPITTAIPLIGVLTLTAVKDAYDDIVSFFFPFSDDSHTITHIIHAMHARASRAQQKVLIARLKIKMPFGVCAAK